MFEFMTIEEAAVKWNISIQHIRGLCRKGELPGAIKKGTMWFIPNQTEHPSRKKKQLFQFTGTKKRIFEASIDLFSKQSFDSITLKDIADAAGIVQSAVYRHFQSKHEILETIYEYFKYYYLSYRPILADLEPIIQNGTISDIFNSVYYDFGPENEDLIIRCLSIIFQRMSIDKYAEEIFRNYVLSSGLDFAEQVFAKAIEAGKIPQIDPFVLSSFSNMGRLMMLLTWLANSDPALNQKMIYCQLTLQDLIIRGLTMSDDRA